MVPLVSTLEDIRSLSELVHTIQKERGLSSVPLNPDDTALHKLFFEQRLITEALWSAIGTVELLQDPEFALGFPARLPAMRESIEAGAIEWDEINDFYTSAVQRLLDLIFIKVATLDYSLDIVYELHSIVYLANARENMGLVRAALNRGYQRGRLSIKELQFLSHHYGSATENIRVFEVFSKVHFGEAVNSIWLKKIQTETFHNVNDRIKNALDSDGGILSGSQLQWWKDATHVVDNLKNIEGDVLDQIKKRILEKIEYSQGYLFWYGIYALFVLLVVGLLTGFTVRRILMALSTLTYALRQVEQNEDFSVRIDVKSTDEFDQFSLSVNSLLSYTGKLIKEKEYLAATDLLTGVMNRRSFISAAEREIKRNQRYAIPLSLIFCDIDLFKAINDQHGHAVGDQVLVEFARVFKETLRGTDYIGRWGGEEFIVLCVDTDLEAAKRLSEMLRQKIMALSIESVSKLTCSFGVAQKKEAETFDALCKRADQALYEAKDNGRNNVSLSEPVDSIQS